MEIIEEKNDTPGISNYFFANVFYSKSIFMIDLRTGYVVKEWDISVI